MKCSGKTIPWLRFCLSNLHNDYVWTEQLLLPHFDVAVCGMHAYQRVDCLLQCGIQRILCFIQNVIRLKWQPYLSSSRKAIEACRLGVDMAIILILQPWLPIYLLNILLDSLAHSIVSVKLNAVAYKAIFIAGSIQLSSTQIVLKQIRILQFNLIKYCFFAPIGFLSPPPSPHTPRPWLATTASVCVLNYTPVSRPPPASAPKPRPHPRSHPNCRSSTTSDTQPRSVFWVTWVPWSG